MEIENNELSELFSQYESLKERNLFGRYITYQHLLPLLEKLTSVVVVKELGKSVKGVPINAIFVGNGKSKILAWSQMHGNESTTTKALFDFLKACLVHSENPVIKNILSNCSLCIIPMLNPDGAERYTRVNAHEVDLNRDASNRQEPESAILREAFLQFQPDFCFNMHDQRSIFSAGTHPQPATLSFLTPSMDEERTVTSSRKISMQLIVAIEKELKRFIPGKIGRYDDAFNINCTGDTFQSENIPTVLFEAGHFPDDYKREETRKYVFLALVSALYSISENAINNFDWKDYFSIPENEKLFNDVVLKNCIVKGEKKEVAIQFKETLKNGKIEFLPVIEKIEKKLKVFGHKHFDCRNAQVKINDKQELSENVIVDKFWVNDEIFPII
ncbi:MAG: M14 metallopeptidase family protein [Gillisia sp.]